MECWRASCSNNEHGKPFPNYPNQISKNTKALGTSLLCTPFHKFQELEAWFKSHPDGADKDSAPVKLLRLGRLFPGPIFGFYNEKQQFIPGILTSVV